MLIGSRGLLPVADYHRGGARAARRVAAATCRRSRGGSTPTARCPPAIVLGVALSLGALLGVARRALLRAVDAALSLLRRGDARLPVVPVGQPADRVRLPRRVPAHRRGRARRALPVPAGAVQAVLRVRHRQVGIAAARLARRQRDDLLLRDRAAADRGSPGTRTTCPSGGTTSRAAPRWCSSWCSRSAIFGPRRLRLFALAAFTLFQVVNAATANYGFFCYLAVVLGVFLLDDADVVARAGPPRARRPFRAGARCAASPRACRRAPPQAAADRAAALLPAPRPTMGGDRRRHAVRARLAGRRARELRRADPGAVVHDPAAASATGALHLANTYHLFASITRERIEPEFQTLADGPVEDREADDAAWTAQHLRHKPGDVTRAPDFVAPTPAARRLPAVVLWPRLPAPPARVRLDAARAPVRGPAGGAAAVSRAAARRSRLPSASCSGSISSPAPPRSAPQAPGGDGHASRPCARYPAPSSLTVPDRHPR